MLVWVGSIFGCLVAGRTIDVLISESFLKDLNWSRRALVTVNIFVTFHLIFMLSPGFGLAVLAILGASPYFLNLRRYFSNKKRFHDETVELYQDFLLRILSGESIRSCIESSGKDPRWSLGQRELAELALSGRQLSQEITSSDLQLRYEELTSLLLGKSATINRVRSYKDRWVTVQRLKIKKRAATALVRAQVMVTGLLFFLLVAVRLWMDHLFLRSPWLWSSVLMVTLGLFWIHHAERSFKWKH